MLDSVKLGILDIFSVSVKHRITTLITIRQIAWLRDKERTVPPYSTYMIVMFWINSQNRHFFTKRLNLIDKSLCRKNPNSHFCLDLFAVVTFVRNQNVLHYHHVRYNTLFFT